MSKMSVRQIIAIRKSIAAKQAAAVDVAVDAPVETVAKAPRLKVAKVEGYGSDAGKVRLYVSKGEVAFALGLEGSKETPAGLGLKAVVAAVSQSTYAKDGNVVTRLGDRIDGVAGLEALNADFGNGSVRGTWFDGEKLADLVGAEGVSEGFAALQVASDARAAASDKRWEMLKAKNAERAALKAAGETAPEAVAA